MNIAKELGNVDGEALRAARERIGMTREELADLIGIEEHQLAGVEKGYRQLNESTVMKLIALVGKDGELHRPEEKNGSGTEVEAGSGIKVSGVDVRDVPAPVGAGGPQA